MYVMKILTWFDPLKAWKRLERIEIHLHLNDIEDVREGEDLKYNYVKQTPSYLEQGESERQIWEFALCFKKGP